MRGDATINEGFPRRTYMYNTYLSISFIYLYRVGLRVLLPGSFSDLRWFGRGPHENYPDRKVSAAIGRYASQVSEQATPYIRPGECGAKVDVRWLEVSRPSASGRQGQSPVTGTVSAAAATVTDDSGDGQHAEEAVSDLLCHLASRLRILSVWPSSSLVVFLSLYIYM